MITVLTGSNRYGVGNALTAIKQQFVAEFGGSGVEVYSGEQLEVSQLSGLTQGASLFATQRLVIIKDLSKNKALAEQLLLLLQAVPAETHLVLVEESLDKRTALYKTLKKEADFQELNELDEPAAITWVRNTVAESKGIISSADARLLVQYCGVDQLRLTNEIAKLLAYDSKISAISITELVEKNPQETVFQLLEQALGKKTNQALNTLEVLEQAHEDPFQTASMLVWQATILAAVSTGKERAEAEIAKDFKLNPYVVKKTKSLAGRLSTQQMNHILDEVAQLDARLKTTSTDPWRLLENTILSL